jgi:hypothetical protein
MKKQFFLLATLLCLASSAILAQTYNTAIGIRFDDGMNLTAKQSVGDREYLEGMLHTPIFSKDLGITGLWERHRKLGLRNLSFYYGVGAHGYFRNQGRSNDLEVNKNVFGVSGIGGLDICMGRLNFSADVLPELHLTGETSRALEWNGVSISARYIFDKKERKKLRDRIDLPKRKKSSGSSRRRSS